MKKQHLGTEGAFEIILQANKKINYYIKFESKNEKPKNLSFQIAGKDRKYYKLEDMEKELRGECKGSKKIIIKWKWEYQTNQTQDIQDTKDGENISKYNFLIYAIGN